MHLFPCLNEWCCLCSWDNFDSGGSSCWPIFIVPLVSMQRHTLSFLHVFLSQKMEHIFELQSLIVDTIPVHGFGVGCVIFVGVSDLRVFLMKLFSGAEDNLLNCSWSPLQNSMHWNWGLGQLICSIFPQLPENTLSGKLWLLRVDSTITLWLWTDDRNRDFPGAEFGSM